MTPPEARLRLRLVLLFVSLLCPLILADDSQVLLGPAQDAVIIRDADWTQSVWYDWGGHAILQRFLQLATGRQVKVVNQPPGDDGKTVRIWTGRQPAVNRAIGAELDKLDDDGFIIAVRGRDVYVAGKHWWGSNWAAHDFLERFAGCRWYGPEPDFWRPKEAGMLGPLDIVPKQDHIRVPIQATIVEQPVYKMRWYRFMPLHSFRLRYRDKFHHALSTIIPPDKYGQSHPEFFPLIGGKRRIPPAGAPHQFQPCVSNPQVLRLVVETARESFEKNPREGAFSIGMNDTDAFCECDNCLAAAPANITDKRQRQAWAFFDFYNRIAAELEKTHPDKRLGCLAYAGLSVLPPGTIKLHPMIVPYLTRDSAQLFDPNEQAEFRQLVDRWKRLAVRMGIYEYIYGRGFVVPRLYNRYLLANVRDRYGVGVDGFYAESYPNWGLDGPKYWLLSRMLWDNRQDRDKLMDQYCRDLFGPAAGEMKAYFDFLEQTWCTQTLASTRSNYRWFLDAKQLEIFPPSVCEKAWAMLESARAKAGGDAMAVKRIDYFRDTFALTRALSRRYAATAGLDELMNQPPPRPPASLDAWLAPRLAGLQAYLDCGELDAVVKSVPAGAMDDYTQADLARYDRQPVDAVAAMVEAVDAASSPRPAADNPPQNAKDFIDHLAARSVLRATRLAKPPALDGAIAAGEWPAPAFAGRLFRIHSLTPHERQTLIHAAWDEANLYLAFDCRQPKDTVRAAATGPDRGEWRQPAMLGDDCVALTIRPGTAGVRINANGALGFHHNAWGEGICGAARPTEAGWQAELAIPLGKLGLKAAPTPAGADPTKLCRLAIARFAHNQPQPPPDKAKPQDRPRPDAYTILPAPHGKGIIGHGNHPNLMTFITGPRLILAD